VDRSGRFGAVTNFREPSRPRPGAPSRGELIPSYLRHATEAGASLAALAPGAATYAGFNLLLADARSLWYASNRTFPLAQDLPGSSSSESAFARPLPPGIHGLSNALLDAPWPKVSRVRRGFIGALAQDDPDPEQLLALLADRTQAHRPEELPLTGIDPAWEQTLSSPFVVHPAYGTRSSTVVLMPAERPPGSRSAARGATLTIIERRFDARGDQTGTTELHLPP
jgi:uncharacterized protein with NRDE domain